jgi:hypothetical protein
MLRSLLSRFGFGRERDGETGDEDEDEAADRRGGFQRSELDASVLYAHGMDVDRLETEIADIEEQAREIEDARRTK